MLILLIYENKELVKKHLPMKTRNAEHPTLGSIVVVPTEIVAEGLREIIRRSAAETNKR